MNMVNNNIKIFHDAELIESNIETLKEIESIVGEEFSIVEDVNWNTKMGFTSSNNRVSELGLYDCNLKTLPEALTRLKSLKELYIYENNLSALPESLSKLKSIEKLDLRFNSIKTLPAAIGDLSALKKLLLNFNSIETFPEEFIKLLLSSNVVDIDTDGKLLDLIMNSKIRKSDPEFFESQIRRALQMEGKLSAETSLFLIRECKMREINGIKSLLALLKSQKIADQRFRDHAENELISILKGYNFRNNNRFQRLNQSKAQKNGSKQKNLRNFLREINEAHSLARKLWSSSTGDSRANFEIIRNELEELIGEIKNILPKPTFLERIKNGAKKFLGKIKKLNPIMFLFYIAAFFGILISIFSVRPYFHIIPSEWFAIIFILALIFAFFKGLALLPTLSSYIEHGVKIIDIIGSKINTNSAVKVRKKVKRFLLKALDLLVFLYLINAIRKLLELFLEMEIMPLALTLDWFDLVFMSALFAIISAFLIINDVHKRGIDHLWKSSVEEIRAKSKSRHLVLILGIIGTFCYFLLTLSTWQPLLLVPNYIAISLGAIIYIENRFKKRWRLRALFYFLFAPGLALTYFITIFGNLILGFLIGFIFVLIFLSIWWESLRRTLWLSRKFTFPWYSEKDKDCFSIYGQLVLPDYAKALKNLFNIQNNKIENKIARSKIKIERREVLNLNLSYKELTTLSESIGHLKSLQNLNLRGNNLKALPESIGQLKSLQNLNLRGNNLKALPESIGQLKSLQNLNLRGNNLKALPESIGQLNSLEELQLSRNDLRTVPESIVKLKSLKKLSLNSNAIEKFPESVTKLRSLRILELWGNKLTRLPDSIKDLTTLENLVLGGNSLQSLPSSIKNLLNLKILDIRSNPLNSKILNSNHWEKIFQKLERNGTNIKK